ncbi:tudor and KH domain-containing protein isoform X2 [Colius striatus]|uniref:tudor and KH domain-containing protein isoform X2 n=1 Tax=Colius striatus TaxID=57412 RepID=UPI002B1E5DF7|nr:tudor and KH domain-containing protein isoform X2 [Colius striatus]
MAAGRGCWGSLSTPQKAAVVLGIPAGATVLYILYRRYRESQEEKLTFVGEEELEVTMRVPQGVVKSIIGRKGATIRRLRQETRACIEVETEEEGEDTVLLISGSPSQVCRAKAAIHHIVSESSPVSEQLCVPRRAVGRIIGRGGETVRGICRSSGAKVLCEADTSLAPVRLVRLSGTRQEVAAAKKLIMEKLQEEDTFRQELAQATATRCRRRAPLCSRGEPELLLHEAPQRKEEEEQEEEGFSCTEEGSSWAESPVLGRAPSEELEAESQEPEEPVSGQNAAVPKFEVPSPDFSFHADEHLEVYVSATENPDHFWIQLVGQRSLQLDKLTAEMRLYYGSSGQAAQLPSVQPGDIVAAPYAGDTDWYRARVLGTLDNGHLDLYYVDFGDNGEAPLEALRALRSDFLSLPFQAIECSLAGVTPIGSQWDEAALDEFDRLTHCASWQPLLAKVTSYVPAGLSTRPNVQLYTPHHGKEEEEQGPGEPTLAPAAMAGTGEPAPCPSLDSLISAGTSPSPPALSPWDGASGSGDGGGVTASGSQ